MQTLAWITISLGVLTALAIAADESRHPQDMQIMNIVWPVTGLYFPVIGLWLYRAMGRPIATHAHHAGGNGVFLSALHCGAGCVLGDIVAVALFGPGLATEFAFAYLFGIAFQYLPIRAMRHIPPAAALWDAIKADTLSLLAFELGMFGWMAIARFWLSEDAVPSSIVFWFTMQIAMIVGLAATYPANWLLVRWGVKGAM